MFSYIANTPRTHLNDEINKRQSQRAFSFFPEVHLSRSFVSESTPTFCAQNKDVEIFRHNVEYLHKEENYKNSTKEVT